MKISVVIPTHNQKERLRLVLCGLEQQSLGAQQWEVVVVDDGSTDGTSEMLEAGVKVRLVRLEPNQGRNRARNRGIEAAAGELIVFLDGDALPAPDLLQRYWEAYRCHGERAVFCGMQYSLPELEYFQNPQTGSLMDLPLSSVLRDYIAGHREEMVVNEDMVRHRFALIRERAREGGYPFEALKERQDQVLQLFACCERPAVGWLGFIPHNGAVPRALLQQVGGFDEAIPFSEGWELAYRLQCREGARVYPVQAASYHLYHYHPFAEEEGGRAEARKRYQAIEYMADKHGDPRIRLLYFWFAHLWPDPYVPEEATVADLEAFDRLYRELPREEWEEYEAILQRHPLLSPSFENEIEVSYGHCA